MHDTALRGARFQRYTSPYTSWMVQRPRGAFGALSTEAQVKVRAAREGTGLLTLLDFQPRHRLGKRNFKLVLHGVKGAAYRAATPSGPSSSQ